MSTFLDERGTLVELPPRPVVSAISLATPELIVPSAGDPKSFGEIDDEIKTLKESLDVTSALLTIPLSDPDARTVISEAKDSAALDATMTSPLQVLDVDAWVANIYNATATIQSSNSRIQLLNALKQATVSAVLADRRRLFKEALRAYPDYKGALSDLVVMFDRSREDDRVVSLTKLVRLDPSFKWKRAELEYARAADANDRQVPELNKPYNVGPGEHPFLWRYIADREGNAFIDVDGKYVSIPRVSLFSRGATWSVTQILADFEPDRLSTLFSVAADKLGEEVQILTRFLVASDKLLKKHIQPRAYVEGTVSNRGKNPLTVTPEAGLQVKLLSDNKSVTIPLTLIANGTGETVRNGTYATVASGAVARIRWRGSFSGSTQDWIKFRDAYRSGALACAIAVQTPDKEVSVSPDAKFEPLNQQDSTRTAERQSAAVALFAHPSN